MEAGLNGLAANSHSDLRNYSEVLRDVALGAPVFLTKNGRGRYAIQRKHDTGFESWQEKQSKLSCFANGENQKNLTLHVPRR